MRIVLRVETVRNNAFVLLAPRVLVEVPEGIEANSRNLHALIEIQHPEIIAMLRFTSETTREPLVTSTVDFE